MTLYFRRREYRVQEENDVRSNRPELVIRGRTAFSFIVTVLEVDGTATGKDCDLYLHTNDRMWQNVW